jgi:hypothetical protein
MESALEKKYGKNDLDSLIICPRCADAVPAFVRVTTITDRFDTIRKREVHCLKCKHYGHKDGTYIKELSTATTSPS